MAMTQWRMKWHQSIGFLFIKAGHQHRHYSIRRLSPVPEHSGLGPLIAVSDWFWHLNSFPFRYRTDRMPDGPAFTKTVPRCKGVNPARPYCWWWRRDTLHDHTAGGGGETPCTSILLVTGETPRRTIMLVVMDRHPARPCCLWLVRHPARPYCWWWTGHRNTPCTSIHWWWWC
jgi:hypothetical protein